MGMNHSAQICRNGHVVTTLADSDPGACERFCSRCGGETMTACEHCNASIRGDRDIAHAVVVGDTYALPRFCHACGKPYSWTTARLNAAAELADELDDLSAEEREQLKKSLVELVHDTPAAELAAVRVKKTLRNVGNAGLETFRKVLVDVLSEAAKKSLGI